MDYSKSGSAKFGKGTPHHVEAAAKETDAKAKGQRATKAELLARMKAASEAKKPG